MQTVEFYLAEVEKLENVDIAENLRNGDYEIPLSAIDGDDIDYDIIESEHGKKIISLLDKAIKVAPNNPTPCLKKAEVLRKRFSRESITEIVECYDMAIKLDPDNAEYYLKKSFYSYDVGNYSLGSILYKKAIELKKDDLNFIVGIAEQLRLYCRDFEALGIYDDLISENSDLPQLYYLRANHKGHNLFFKTFSGDGEDFSENENIDADWRASRSYDQDSTVQQYRAEALIDINKALELKPDDEDFLNLKEQIITMDDDY